MKVGIMGFGTVGLGAYKIAQDTAGIEIVKIFSRRLRPECEEVLKEDGNLDIFTTNAEEIWQDDRIDVVIESMGGVDPAADYVMACLNAGKHVVTPNKNLISACYDELMCAALDNDVILKFTPTAGGGIPWLFNLERTKRCDRILEVSGIVNGTCNYILDAMHTEGADYSQTLKKAQELGYAEADPTSDVCGTDTLRKAVISTNVAFNTVINENSVPCCGIDKIDKADIDWFNKNGYTCKLMMHARRLGEGRITVYVEPTLFKSDTLEAHVGSNNNLITLVGEKIGKQCFYGQGAGMLPTGESVIQDVVDIMQGGPLQQIYNSEPVVIDNNSEIQSYYLSYNGKRGIATEVTVAEMHKIARDCEAKELKLFFAAVR